MVVGRVTASTAILQNEQPASITRDEIINAIERALEQVLQSSSITASSRLLARAMFVATPPRTDVEHDTWCEVCNKLCEGGLNPPDKDIWMAAVRSVCRNDPGKVEYLSDCFPFERWELMGNPSAAVLPRPPADDIRPIPVILPVESQPSKQTASKDKSSIKKKNFLRRRVRTQDPTRVPTDQEVLP